MASFLVEQVERFGQHVKSGSWRLNGAEPGPASREVAELVSTALHLLDRVEAAAAAEQPPRPAWDEKAARRFVPLFRQWFEQATVVLDLVRECGRRGDPVPGREAFIHRYNVAKVFATDFERTAESQRQWERGDRSGRSLDEVSDELRRPDEPAGF